MQPRGSHVSILLILLVLLVIRVLVVLVFEVYDSIAPGHAMHTSGAMVFVLATQKPYHPILCDNE